MIIAFGEESAGLYASGAFVCLFCMCYFLSYFSSSLWPGISVGDASTWHAVIRAFDPQVRQHSFMEIGHEIISMAILSLP